MYLINNKTDYNIKSLIAVNINMTWKIVNQTNKNLRMMVHPAFI